jgi:hypothetical protein
MRRYRIEGQRGPISFALLCVRKEQQWQNPRKELRLPFRKLTVSTLAMTDAFWKLLIDKGIITDEEFKKTRTRAGGLSGGTEVD